MNKRLIDFKTDKRIKRPIFTVLPIKFGHDEATKRVVTHTARRVIKQHKVELQNLAYK